MKGSNATALLAAAAAAAILWTDTAATANQSPYTGLETRQIKALSPEQIQGYEEGRGMGLALAAELNGYPGPKHVLELQNELELSAEQLEATEAIFHRMQTSAMDLGQQIVEGERKLDQLFADHSLDADELDRRSREIGELQGRLRAAHLQAHLQMIEVLSSHQVRRYIELRGYHEEGMAEHHGHGAQD